MRVRATSYSGTRFGGFYLLFQGLTVFAWWLLLWRVPDLRLSFRPPGAAEIDLLAFAVPDLALLMIASMVAGALTLAGSKWALPLGWLVAGAVVYATLYCISWALLRGGGWSSVAAMSPVALFSTIAALDGSAGVVPIFRRAGAGSAARHLAATFLQIVLFWSLFLYVVPRWIAQVEELLGLPTIDFPLRTFLGWALLAVASALGVASGWTIAAQGSGTPLPMDATNRLVTSGPYGHVRNPMVVAGLAQGLASALVFGSPAVAVYVLVGGAIWQLLVRPAEEADLATKFGHEFENYRAAVRCWWPNLTRYRAGN